MTDDEQENFVTELLAEIKRLNRNIEALRTDKFGLNQDELSCAEWKR